MILSGQSFVAAPSGTATPLEADLLLDGVHDLLRNFKWKFVGDVRKVSQLWRRATQARASLRAATAQPDCCADSKL